MGREFGVIGPSLSSTCVYGGAPYGAQGKFTPGAKAAALATVLTLVRCVGGSAARHEEDAIRRGLDVVIGTPGRLKDHLDKGTLKLNDLR